MSSVLRQIFRLKFKKLRISTALRKCLFIFQWNGRSFSIQLKWVCSLLGKQNVIPLRKLKLGVNTKHIEKWTIVWSWGGKSTLICFSVVLLQIRNCISICMSLWNGTIILALFCCSVNNHIFLLKSRSTAQSYKSRSIQEFFFIKTILMAFTSLNATLFLFPN